MKNSQPCSFGAPAPEALKRSATIRRIFSHPEEALAALVVGSFFGFVPTLLAITLANEVLHISPAIAVIVTLAVCMIGSMLLFANSEAKSEHQESFENWMDGRNGYSDSYDLRAHRGRYPGAAHAFALHFVADRVELVSYDYAAQSSAVVETHSVPEDIADATALASDLAEHAQTLEAASEIEADEQRVAQENERVEQEAEQRLMDIAREMQERQEQERQADIALVAQSVRAA